MNLDADTCYRALAARDGRFDGLFFVGVSTTGIYCRPVCVARTPGKDRCRFYLRAAEAERDGFRACFRCRPELAPGAAPVDAVSRMASAAVSRIGAGALDEGSLEELATEFGVSSRHLRRAIEREAGVSPVELAQSRRLGFAKQLLQDTRLPMTEVAFASGFESVRRFNALFQERFRRPPTALRRQAGEAALDERILLRLDYRAPLDWEALLRFFAARATPGVEAVRGERYLRAVRLGARRGWIVVDAAPRALRVEVSRSLAPVLMAVVSRVRRLFDLDAQPVVIAAHLSRDRRLRKLVAAHPGLRLPGSFDGFDAAVRAVLGQQVSVAAATTFSGRLAEKFGERFATPHPELFLLAPTATRLSSARASALASIGLTKARAATLLALSRAVADGLRLEPPADPARTRDALLALPGIGEWTADYIAMRALAWPDAFLGGDLGIRKALGGISEREATGLAERWRPWRAYAGLHLWQSLSKGITK